MSDPRDEGASEEGRVEAIPPALPRTRRERPQGYAEVARTRREPDARKPVGGVRPPPREPGGRAKVGRLRTVLPDELLERFKPLGQLGMGGEAAVVLVEPVGEREQFALKLYNSNIELEPEIVKRLYLAEAEDRMVHLHDHGCADGEWWELQEYVPGGSLRDLLDSAEGGLPEDTCQELLEQLVDAIGFVHGLDLTHRDVTPGNVLVRKTDELDVVLSDFGTAMLQEATFREATRGVGTDGYRPPESLDGSKVGPPYDLWSLGIIVHEALTGQLPFVTADGLPLSSVQVNGMLREGRIPLDALDPWPRWRHLVAGLLQPRPEDRFGLDDVRCWLAGDLPALPDSPHPVDPDQPALLELGAATYRTPREMAIGFANGWASAARALGGPNQWYLASRWLIAHEGSAMAALLDGLEAEEAGPDRKVARLIAHLAPDIEARFRQLSVTPAALQQLATGVLENDADARTELDRLYIARILREYAPMRGCEQYPQLQADWIAASERFVAITTQASSANDQIATPGPEQRIWARAEILLALLDDTRCEQLVDRATPALSEIAEEIRRVPPLHLDAAQPKAEIVARQVAAVVLQPAAARLAQERRARQQRLDEQHREEQERAAEEQKQAEIARRAAENQRARALKETHTRGKRRIGMMALKMAAVWWGHWIPIALVAYFMNITAGPSLIVWASVFGVLAVATSVSVNEKTLEHRLNRLSSALSRGGVPEEALRTEAARGDWADLQISSVSFPNLSFDDSAYHGAGLGVIALIVPGIAYAAQGGEAPFYGWFLPPMGAYFGVLRDSRGAAKRV